MTLLLIGNLSISLATRNGLVPVLPSALRASSRSGRAAVSSTWWSGLCVGRSGHGARPTTGTDRPTRPVSPAPRTGQSARSPRAPAPVSPPDRRASRQGPTGTGARPPKMSAHAHEGCSDDISTPYIFQSIISYS